MTDIKCKNCSFILDYKWNYCPKCGKKVYLQKKIIKRFEVGAPVDISKAKTDDEFIKKIMKTIDLYAYILVEIYDDKTLGIMESYAVHKNKEYQDLPVFFKIL